MAAGVPTFPKAKYLFADAELAHWTSKHAVDPAAVPWITDSVLPIIAANRVETVKSDHKLGDAIQLLPTPGHSIDHFSVQVGKAGADAIITGDAIHSPIQTHYPEIGMFSDYHAKQGAESRRKLLERCCDTRTRRCAPRTSLRHRSGRSCVPVMPSGSSSRPKWLGCCRPREVARNPDRECGTGQDQHRQSGENDEVAGAAWIELKQVAALEKNQQQCDYEVHEPTYRVGHRRERYVPPLRRQPVVRVRKIDLGACCAGPLRPRYSRLQTAREG